MTPHGERSREIWHPSLKRKETAMAIFDETYRVVGVESQRLILGSPLRNNDSPSSLQFVDSRDGDHLGRVRSEMELTSQESLP